ncbi:MAG: ABC transporter ATP-binding protein [Candidatus Omnitrophica bacterium]|nr:ABC transporter ATP-binding protein [Candidatus Omnitrophota bacterium]MCM8799094.1 ABC transporter ATP-binding protein [Candidatus Omnitrophota bacterium]
MIEIINLCKSFGDKIVLNNLNLKINTGETVVVIGRSGCGKSVLLKLIIGLLKPDAGEIIIDGEDITRVKGKDLDRIRMKCGMLFQNSALFDSLTVRENVGFFFYEHEYSEKEKIEKRIAECLNLVGLPGIEELYPSQLSGGMKKRVALARAICMHPEIILYDEPTTGVDPITADAINNLIVALHDKLKVTAIAVTHDMKSAFKIGDRIAMLYKGKIIASGTPREIMESSNPIVKQFIQGESEGVIAVEEEGGG